MAAYTGDTPVAAEHHHHEGGEGTSGLPAVVAIVLIVLLAILFLVYGTRFLNTRSTTPSVNVPDQVDVNLNK